jgi:transcriptional regulator with XRE-family HTH domain
MLSPQRREVRLTGLPRVRPPEHLGDFLIERSQLLDRHLPEPGRHHADPGKDRHPRLAFQVRDPGALVGAANRAVDQMRDARLAGQLGHHLAAPLLGRNSRRAWLTPADVGLPEGSASGRRRTPGLRREEVAQLSGVGVTWYTWLEQGRDISASPQVIDALARALLLNPDQHRHLRELAGLPAPEPEWPGQDILPRLQSLVDAVAPSPASIYDSHFDYLAWNEPYAKVRHDPGALPAGRRNMIWMMFTDADNRARMTGWEPAARAVLRPVPHRRRPAFRRPPVRRARSGANRGQPGVPEVVDGLPGPLLQARDDQDQPSAGRADRAANVPAPAG